MSNLPVNGVFNFSNLFMKYRKGTFTVVPNKDILRGKNPYLQIVYFWICDHANEEGVCFPSRQHLADESGVSLKTVDNMISELIKIGLLMKQTRKDGKQNLSNIYQVMLLEVSSSVSNTPPSVPDTLGGSVPDDTVTQPTLLNSPNELKRVAKAPQKYASFEEFMEEKGYSLTEVSSDSEGSDVTQMWTYPDPVTGVESGLWRGKVNALKREYDNLRKRSGQLLDLESVKPSKPQAKNSKRSINASSEVISIFQLFEKIQPAYGHWGANKTQKRAAQTLLDEFGYEKTKNMVMYYLAHREEEYMPQIFSPYDLLSKYPKLKQFKDKNNQ